MPPSFPDTRMQLVSAAAALLQHGGSVARFPSSLCRGSRRCYHLLLLLQSRLIPRKSRGGGPSLAMLEEDCGPNQRRILLVSPAFCSPQSPEAAPFPGCPAGHPLVSLRCGPGAAAPLRGAEHWGQERGPGEGTLTPAGLGSLQRAGAALSPGGSGRFLGTGGRQHRRGGGWQSVAVTAGRWRGSDGDRAGCG